MTKIADVSRDSSTSGAEDSEELRIHKFAKHMLRGSLFIGTFQEKRFVGPLNSYRDVIKVSDEETDLIDNLKAVKKRCARFYNEDLWVGITEPTTIGAPAGYNLWVSLDQEVFGSYWFKIKAVRFTNKEMCLKLEIVRPLSQEKTKICRIKLTPKKDNGKKKSLHDIQQDVSEFKDNVNNYCKRAFETMTHNISFSNVKETIIFVVLLISTLITFFFHAVKYLMEYFLKLMRELSGFIQVCSPVIISLVGLMTNTINGFFNAIVNIFRSNPHQVNNVPYPNVQYLALPYQQAYYQTPEPNNYRAIPYHKSNFSGQTPFSRKRSSVKITPLDDL